MGLAAIMVLLTGASALCAQVVPRPGTTFVHPLAETVLHGGPSPHHAGALTLRPEDVVRVDGDGTMVKVYVPRGFPVYVHGDFAVVHPEEQRVEITGSRVNARLLPATVGLLPVGQVGRDDGPLQLLDEEGDWVRVLAPVTMPLWGPAEAFEPLPDGSAAWRAAFDSREERRQAAIAAHRATDPGWALDERLDAEVDVLARVAVEELDDAGLAAHRVALAELEAQVRRDGTRHRLEQLLGRVAAELADREDDRERLAEAERRRAREAATLLREARALGYGLRFLGKGDAVTVEGTVSRTTIEDGTASVYSIAERSGGRRFKLTAADEIADLSDLVGRSVVLEGRTLPLVNVEGPVLVVDRVVRVDGS